MYRTGDDPRRGKHWRKTATFTRQLTGDRCIVCGKPADEVHHMFYGFDLSGVTPFLVVSAVLSQSILPALIVPLFWGRKLPIADLEIPGWQVIPLCDDHHSNRKGCAHSFELYRAYKNNPWRNHNISGYVWKMRIRFLRRVLF